MTPFIVACIQENIEIILLLLKAGADVNEQDMVVINKIFYNNNKFFSELLISLMIIIIKYTFAL